MGLIDKLASGGLNTKKQLPQSVSGHKELPLWDGPCSNTKAGGISFSLLSRFLQCRERFRLLVVEGLAPEEGFSQYLHFGNMWHICEEAHAGNVDWALPLKTYAQSLCRQFPLQQDQVDKYFNICHVMFPTYVKYWAKHKDVTTRTPIFQEQVFNVPYELPSGRMVYLRGKWDSVDLIGKGKSACIKVQENKTKSELSEQQIRRQMAFDLQTMLYVVALNESRVGYGEHGYLNFGGTAPVTGVRYNVIRRPRQYQGKKETKQDFYDRLKGIVAESPEEFFARWSVEITPTDCERFQRECLNPVLEHLCDWWDWITREENLDNRSSLWLQGQGAIHWRHPFGVRNILDEGGSSDLDAYLESGSTVGLSRRTTLFGELE